ncbi:DEAD/DEAH box helicase [Erysipelothrix sp. HDW6C]|uniref:DEAD/DEAH box helicase n=1 Tax=Erysipelothrix sp. HDW6C TaxID=2714930 RepID=UPI001409FA58|nr:DEAD/DEAH box helicase [Erysipelothrix sp. HDW6C]QIK70767.1 DEAD/DEAH box helicase [Erysipelothrix sp. HDW6C]
MNKFRKLNIGDDVVRALEVIGYTEPTEVQEAAIPHILNGEDLVIKSQTGSGKTASFGIPIAEMIEWEERRPQALVLTPTRELALQIRDEIFSIGRFKRLKVQAVFGKSSFEIQQRDLAQMTHVVVATPGRLIDHINRRTIDLRQIDTVIIDEADEMFNMGFIEQVEEILRKVPRTSSTILLSATLPESIAALASAYLNDPTYIEVENENSVGERIDQQYYRIQANEKLEILRDVLTVENPDSSIIFCNTKIEVDNVADALWDMGIKVETLHGGMEQRHRTKVINDFKHGMFRYLVATDVASRGLDIDDVGLVVNYDIPDHAEIYTHRIGRTARVEKEGKAISFVTPYDSKGWEYITDEREFELQSVVRPGRSLVADRKPQFISKMNRKPKVKKSKDHNFKSEIAKLHIKGGKKQKLRAGDVVGAIASISGIEAGDIGVIEVLEESTYVEILNNKGSDVLKVLKEAPIKGKVRRVEIANKNEYEKQY